MAFDENKYKSIFESRYGSGSYESGLANARKMGQLKAQAGIAKQQFDSYQSKAKAASKKKTYTDALTYFNDPSVKAAIKQDGAYKVANDIKNDPQKQADIKAQGFNVSDYLDAMYNAVSDGKFRSQREYGQYQGDISKQAKAENAIKDKKFKDSHSGYSYDEWQDFQKSLKPTQSKKKTQKDLLPAIKKKDDRNAFEKVADAVNSPLRWFDKNVYHPVEKKAERLATSITDGIMFGQLKKNVTKDNSPKFVQDASKKATNTTDKVIDTVGEFAGAAAPIGGAAKVVSPLIKPVARLLPQVGKLGIASKVAESALRGGATMGTYGAAREGIDAITHPNDATFADRAKRVGMDTLYGAAFDPLLSVGGPLALKGLQTASNSTMRNLLPTQNEVFNSFGQSAKSDLMPKPLPSIQQNSNKLYNNLLQDLQLKTNPSTQLQEGLNNFRQTEQQPLTVNAEPLPTTPNEIHAAPMSQEFQDAVQQQYEYLKSSMGKGVEYGTTGTGAGNFREVNGSFRISNNPKWYQDFYKQYGRKPNEQELRQLAEQHVREGFQDELGSLPAWQPEEVQAIDDQINEIHSLIQQNPDQEAVFKPILDGLQEDRAAALKKTENISPGTLKAGKDYEPIAAGNEKEPVLAPVAKDLLDAEKQASGDVNSFREKVNRNPVKEKSNFLSNLRTQFVDDVAPLETLEKNVAGKVGSAENSLYKQARLFKGSPEKAHMVVQEQLQPLFKDLQTHGIDSKDLGDYALAVHAKDVNEKGINSGFTNAEIEDTIAKLGTPEMEAARKKLLAVNNNVLDTLKQGGIISDAQVQGMKEKWPNYVSLFRSFDDDKIDFSNGISKALANASSPIKKLEGSNRQVIDPLESVVKNIFKATNTVDRNKVASQIGKLAEKDTEGNFIRKLDNKDDTSRLNVVSVMEDGKKVKYEVPPEVYKTLMNLDKESSNTLIKILQKPAATLRAGATLTPEFSLRNPLRDVPNAFVVSKSGFNPAIDFPVGLWQSIWKGRTIKIGNKEFKTAGDLYKEFIKENGGYGNVVSMDRKLHQETLKKALASTNKNYVDLLDMKTYKAFISSFKNPLNVLRNVADVSETATKVGEFRAAKRSGASPQEAAYRARDLMDFGRAGVSVREANKVVAFLNANIQGKSKLLRAFKENPVQVTGKAVAAVTLPTIGAIVAQNTYANDKQKEIINDAPQWLKDTFYLVPIPGTNQIARIPKPFDLSFAFSNSIERAFDFVAKHDKQAFDGFIKQGFTQASVPVMLTGLAPIVEGMANYSFFRQGPIIPKREENLNYPDQYDINTSETAKFIGKGINKLTGGQGSMKNFGSPRIIDNTIQGFTGGTGTYVTSAIDALLNSTGAVDNPEKPAKSIDQQPLTRAFLVNQSSSGESLDKLYNLKGQLTKDRGSAKQNHQPFMEEPQYKMANQATKSISEISAQIRLVENDKSLSSTQKKSMIDQLIQTRNKLARQAMEQLRNQE
jgi:hypothetical protein